MNRLSELAQLHTVPSDFFLWWVIVFIVVLGVFATVVTVWSNLRQRPPHEIPTRREFDELKNKVSHIESSLQPMEWRIVAAFRETSKELEEKIEKLAASDHEERVEIWSKFNQENKAIGERVARLEAVAKSKA
jgi:hypothetical protein